MSWLSALIQAAGAAAGAAVQAWSATRANQRVKSAPPPVDGADQVDAKIDAERAARKAAEK